MVANRGEEWIVSRSRSFLPKLSGLALLMSAHALGAPIDSARLVHADQAIAVAIAKQQIPGAVLLVGRGDKVVYRKAYGQRSKLPRPEAMSVDTIFDLASLTKPIATATSIMILVEEGKLRLSDRVATWIPEFARHGKESITVRHLLTHVSGLRGSLDLSDSWVGSERALALAADESLQSAPGEKFLYSDIGYLLLGEIVARASGRPLDDFVDARILQPLGMRDSMFNPPELLRERIAPTEFCSRYGWPCRSSDELLLRGLVHDPTARRMSGIAGHAGLFGTADDIARYCRMLLRGGTLGSTRILSTLSVTKMTSPASPSSLSSVRGLGWDIDTAYSSNRGELLPIGSFGHTGWTGTSVWIDPLTQTYIVLLTNRLHPDGKGDAVDLRARIATIVAAALGDLPATQRLRSATWTGTDFGAAPAKPARTRLDGRTLNGIDVLRASEFRALEGRRVGLLTNHSGRARDGTTTIELLTAAPRVKLAALFSPEHGIDGSADAKVPSSIDPKSGLPIHSLYGESTRPTAAMLRGLDTIVVDLQDVGARFYTYLTTVGYLLEEAKRAGIAVVVLDRVNPIGGNAVEGPSLASTELSFVAYHPMPIRHGMTLGELARLLNAEKQIGADLTIIELANWSRDAWFDETGLAWTDPSPNLRSLVAASLYPGVATIEGTNISVGRGTDRPFEWIGAPWIDGAGLAQLLNSRDLPGLRAYPVEFTPRDHKFAGQRCHGVALIVTDREVFKPVRLGVELAAALARLHPKDFDLDAARTLFGADVVGRVRAGEDAASIAQSWSSAEAAWRAERAQYLLYK